MNIHDNDTITIGCVKYHLETVLKLAKTGPNVLIKDGELNDPKSDQHKVVIRSTELFTDNGAIVFYKQNGCYTVILGKDTLDKDRAKLKFDGEFHGYLISTVALKKAKLS